MYCVQWCLSDADICLTRRGGTIDASKSRCSFMSLSPELRNRIYALALRPQHDGEGGIPGTRAIRLTAARGDEDPEDFEGRTFYTGAPPWQPPLYTAWAQQPALTRISREVRRETLPVYYGANLFVIVVEGIIELKRTAPVQTWKTHGAESWLHNVGASNIALLRNLEICLDHRGYLDASGSRLWREFPKAIRRGTLSRLFTEEKLDVRLLGRSYLYDDGGEQGWVPIEESESSPMAKAIRPLPRDAIKEESMAFRLYIF